MGDGGCVGILRTVRGLSGSVEGASVAAVLMVAALLC